MTHTSKLPFKQCYEAEIWYTKSPNDNEHDQGSKFWLWIPAAPQPGAAIL